MQVINIKYKTQPKQRFIVQSRFFKSSTIRQNCGGQYPSIARIWRRNGSRVIPFFDYPAEIRKVIYTTNAIESINMGLRKIIKNHSSLPTDEAASKLLYLALNTVSGTKHHQPQMDHANS